MGPSVSRARGRRCAADARAPFGVSWRRRLSASSSCATGWASTPGRSRSRTSSSRAVNRNSSSSGRAWCAAARAPCSLAHGHTARPASKRHAGLGELAEQPRRDAWLRISTRRRWNARDAPATRCHAAACAATLAAACAATLAAACAVARAWPQKSRMALRASHASASHHSRSVGRARSPHLASVLHAWPNRLPPTQRSRVHTAASVSHPPPSISVPNGS
eukprot:793085-Pleurochrysis_carterae.AAC.1